MFDQIARKLRTPYYLARILIVLAGSLSVAYGGDVDPRSSYALWQQLQLERRHFLAIFMTQN